MGYFEEIKIKLKYTYLKKKMDPWSFVSEVWYQSDPA